MIKMMIQLLFTLTMLVPLSGVAEETTPELPHVELSDQALTDSGMSLDVAGPASLRIMLTLPGRLVPNEDMVAHITPRFAGIIRDVRKRLGDSVKQGDTLAAIESNQSIQLYEVRSLISGIITLRHATLGEHAAESSELFTVADFSQLYADFNVFESDVSKIAVGQKVSLKIRDDIPVVESTIAFISPIVDIETQSRFARAVIPNPDLKLQPGEFVSGNVQISEKSVPLAVHQSAIQYVDQKPCLFIRDEKKLVLRNVELGATDGKFTEVLSGLNAGEKYASGNTFLLKAELGKGEAEHED